MGQVFGCAFVVMCVGLYSLILSGSWAGSFFSRICVCVCVRVCVCVSILLEFMCVCVRVCMCACICLF